MEKPSRVVFSPLDGCTLTVTDTGDVYAFNVDVGNQKTYFLQPVISEKGVYVWSVRIVRIPKNGECLCIGAAPGARAGCTGCTGCSSTGLGREQAKDLCGLCLQSFPQEEGMEAPRLNLSLVGVKGDAHILADEVVDVLDKTIITVEIDTFERTLSFFLEGKKIPHIISGLSSPLHLGVSVLGPSYSSISQTLQRVFLPSTSDVVCQKHECE